MSEEEKCVSVCFRPPLELRDAVLLTHGVLRDFPGRVPPRFEPWFPSASDARRPIRPLKPAPAISPEAPPDAPDRLGPAGRFRRSWCVITDRRAPRRITCCFSRLFLRTVEKRGLHPRQRVRWVVCEGNRGPRSMEELWLDLNRAIRRSRLPTCNANYQRALPQIWLYCDFFCSEYIGRFLKRELQLSGPITLTAFKLGDIAQL